MLHRQLLLILRDQNELPRILRVFTLYCCRLVDAMVVRALQRDPLDEGEREEIREIKRGLDASEYRNDLYRALWHLSQKHRWRRRIGPVAVRYRLDPNEVRLCYETLRGPERAEIRARPEPQRYGAEKAAYVFGKVEKAVRRQAWQKMRFAFRNDAGRGRSESEQELREAVIGTIRHYEVDAVEPEDMVRLAARSIGNRARNMARFVGNPNRNPLQRVRIEAPYRIVWYSDVNRNRVDRVCVLCAPRHRSGRYIRARLETGEERLVYLYRLWDQEQEARASLDAFRRGSPGSARRIVIDLSPREQNDWIPTLSSASRRLPNRDTDMTFLDLLQVAPDQEDRCFCAEIDTKLREGPVRRIVDIVINGGDPYFDDFCRRAGEDPSTLSLHRLGLLAREFCGVSRERIAAELSQLPAETWSPHARQLLQEKSRETNSDLAPGH